MLFNSWIFLFAFLPATYFVFWRLKTARQRYIWLTVTGYVFYGFWNYKFCALMALSTLVSYLAGLGMLKWQEPRQRKLCLILPVAFDLCLLGFFKYANFFLGSARSLGESLGFHPNVPTLDIVLPVGISFYTFHTITYIVDAYRRTITPTRNFFEFSCYVSLFAQLVAGPIVRFREIERDIEAIGSAEKQKNLDAGWSFFILGLAKKVLIADTLAAVINPALGEMSTLSTPGAWLCAIGYTYQLYFDFSGYSDMAVGLGLMFGLRLPQNFNSPYRALDPSDFWRRWHISLSTVLRDYLFIPLGGSRGSLPFVCRNLMITMVLGGLWHGASWTFALWGAYHGALLILHRLVREPWSRLPLSLQRGATFLLVVLGWVLFRAESWTMCTAWFTRLFVWSPGPLMPGSLGLLLAGGVAAFVAHRMPNTFELSHRWRPGAAVAMAGLLVVAVLVIAAGQYSPFLYFQF